MIGTILDWLRKIGVHLFQRSRRRPNIRLTLEGNSSNQGGGTLPGRLSFKWYRKLVIHNDSPYLARGIKVVSKIPVGWRLAGDFPTRLEADERVKLDLEIEAQRAREDLINEFGTTMQQKFAELVFPSVLARTALDFEFANDLGRVFHQRISVR